MYDLCYCWILKVTGFVSLENVETIVYIYIWKHKFGMGNWIFLTIFIWNLFIVIFQMYAYDDDGDYNYEKLEKEKSF